MPKVSVIVPIFGVEQYIERCARCLFEQSLDDMEFIFVNDSTKDASIDVLKRVINDYPNRKNQILILHHKKNRGLSHARETGVLAASGEYVAHCDSDDYIDKDMYYELYESANKNSSDIVKCGYTIDLGSHKIPEYVYTKNGALDKNNILEYICNWRGWNNIWTLLAKRKLYEGIQFSDYGMLEDFLVSSQLFIKSENVSIVNKAFYYYCQNPNSICSVKTKDSFAARSKQASANIELAISLIPENIKIKYNLNFNRIKYESRHFLIPAMNSYAMYKYWKVTFPEIGLSPIFTNNLPLKDRIRYLLVELRLWPLIK